MLALEEIGRFIDSDEGSDLKRAAKIGKRYYEAEHDIMGFRLFYYDADSNLVEDKTRSNIKIPHPFFTELVDQCVQHVLSSGECPVASEDPVLGEELRAYFGDEFLSEIMDALTDTCWAGFGYMYRKIGKDGRSRFESANVIGVVEVAAKDANDGQPHVLYWYWDTVDKGRRRVKRIQDWCREATYYYVCSDGGQIAPDGSAEYNPRPHILYTRGDEDQVFYSSFGEVPFYRIDACRQRFSHLKPIKSIIDDYDLMSCGLSNNIQDVSEAVYVVKGFDGDDLSKLQQNIKTTKVVGVGEGGGIDVRTVDIPYEAREMKLDLDERNIYKFGMGLNLASLKDTSATTNLGIQAAYALLDMKCNKLEKQLRSLMRRLVRIALEEINERSGTAYEMDDVKIEFKRESVANATENATVAQTEALTRQTEVATLLNVASIYGSEATLDAVCAILDLDPEEIRGLMPEQEDGGLGVAVSALTADE